MNVLAIGLAAGTLAAAAVAATSSAGSAAPSDAYFGRLELVAREMARHYSTTGPTQSWDRAYGQLKCVGSRDEVRCTSPGRVQGSWPIARVEWRLTLAKRREEEA